MLTTKKGTASTKTTSNEIRGEIRSNKDELITIVESNKTQSAVVGGGSNNCNSKFSLIDSKTSATQVFDLGGECKSKKRIKLDSALESRRVWSAVIDALRRGDFTTAQKHLADKQQQQQKTNAVADKIGNIGAACKYFVRAPKAGSNKQAPMLNSSVDDDVMNQFKWMFKNNTNNNII